MWLKGIKVTLIDITDGTDDDFGIPAEVEERIDVDNVLVCPASDQERTEINDLYGKIALYTLCIPKGDSHDWENKYVEFFGQRWRTIGQTLEYIDALIPLDWNKKVRVESCGRCETNQV